MNSSSYCLTPIVYNESVQCSSAILCFASCLEDITYTFIKDDLELSRSLSGTTQHGGSVVKNTMNSTRMIVPMNLRLRCAQRDHEAGRTGPPITVAGKHR